MNHTQTAQAAMAQAASGQVPEVTTEQPQPVIQIGFEKALSMMDPKWRTALSADQVNQFRHFYHRGVQDISFLIQMSNQNMQQNLDAVMNTVIVTGNEEQLAKLQREAQEAQAAEAAQQAKPTKAARRTPAKKAQPKAPVKTLGLKAQPKAAKKAKK